MEYRQNKTVVVRMTPEMQDSIEIIRQYIEATTFQPATPSDAVRMAVNAMAQFIEEERNIDKKAEK